MASQKSSKQAGKEDLKQGRVSDSPTEALESGEPSIVQRPLGHGQNEPVNSRNPDADETGENSSREG
ncbi:MAG TPA: hypothetical protein VFW23_09785 [Tepidisphaeraceae bacterium]|nr:hypothetical protein [Tepidisphaeraceae bacterium]